MHRVSDLVRAVIDYRIFAILLINDRTQELWMRCQIGRTLEIERTRLKMGRGIVGQAALQRRTPRIDDVSQEEHYIAANPNVRSELAVPLIVKNRVIGVLDVESEIHRPLPEGASAAAGAWSPRACPSPSRTPGYTPASPRQAQTLAVLDEISREITSILDLDDLLGRIGQLLKRVIDYQMFTILAVERAHPAVRASFPSSRYGERVTRDRTVALGEGHHRFSSPASPSRSWRPTSAKTLDTSM